MAHTVSMLELRSPVHKKVVIELWEGSTMCVSEELADRIRNLRQTPKSLYHEMVEKDPDSLPEEHLETWRSVENMARRSAFSERPVKIRGKNPRIRDKGKYSRRHHSEPGFGEKDPEESKEKKKQWTYTGSGWIRTELLDDDLKDGKKAGRSQSHRETSNYRGRSQAASLEAELFKPRRHSHVEMEAGKVVFSPRMRMSLRDRFESHIEQSVCNITRSESDVVGMQIYTRMGSERLGSTYSGPFEDEDDDSQDETSADSAVQLESTEADTFQEMPDLTDVETDGYGSDNTITGDCNALTSSQIRGRTVDSSVSTSGLNETESLDGGQVKCDPSKPHRGQYVPSLVTLWTNKSPQSPTKTSSKDCESLSECYRHESSPANNAEVQTESTLEHVGDVPLVNGCGHKTLAKLAIPDRETSASSPQSRLPSTPSPTSDFMPKSILKNSRSRSRSRRAGTHDRSRTSSVDELDSIFLSDSEGRSPITSPTRDMTVLFSSPRLPRRSLSQLSSGSDLQSHKSVSSTSSDPLVSPPARFTRKAASGSDTQAQRKFSYRSKSPVVRRIASTDLQTRRIRSQSLTGPAYHPAIFPEDPSSLPKDSSNQQLHLAASDDRLDFIPNQQKKHGNGKLRRTTSTPDVYLDFENQAAHISPKPDGRKSPSLFSAGATKIRNFFRPVSPRFNNSVKTERVKPQRVQPLSLDSSCMSPDTADSMESSDTDSSKTVEGLPIISPTGSFAILVREYEGSDECIICQNPGCPEGAVAVKVCHHSDCQDGNGHRPLMLCADCDESIHTGANDTGHLRFDVFRKGVGLNRNTSTRSLPGTPSKSDNEEETASQTLQTSMMGAEVDDVDGDDDNQVKRNTKLKRKKAVKCRRYRTEDAPSTPWHHQDHCTHHTHSHHLRSISLQDGELAKTGTEVSVAKSHENDVDNDNIKFGLNGSDSECMEDVSNANEAKMMTNGNGDNLSQSDEGTGGESTNEVELLDTGQKGEKRTLDTIVRLASENSESSTDENNDQNNDQVDGESNGKYQRMETHRKPNVRKISMPAKSLSSMNREFPRKYSLGMEYFTLKFDLLGQSDVEIVAAVKGVSLKEAIRPALDRRGIHMDSVDVLLVSSKTPLPLVADCFPLGGNSLYVKPRDSDRDGAKMNRSGSTSSLAVNKVRDKEKKPLVSAKSKKSLVAEDTGGFTESSPHGTVSGLDMKASRGKGDKKKIRPFPFSKPAQDAQDRQELLTAHLNSYSLNGLPEMPGLLTIGQRPFDSKLLELEKHWPDVVEIKGELTKKQKDQQEAMWELLTTEVKYINNVKIIKDLFMCCLINLQNESLLNEIETEKLFCNISEVYVVNCGFWEDYLYTVLEHTRKTKEFLSPSLLKEGFLQFDEIFQPYTKYCLEQLQSLDYIKDKFKENELFRTFVLWAEAQKQCNRLKLQDLVVMPMQRLTKYKLLLMAVLKKTEIEDQRRDLLQMIEKVDRFVVGVNTVLHQREEHERLAAIIERIEVYDAIDAPNDECMKLVSEFCKLDLTCPVPGCGPQQRRHLLLEGGLKIKDSTTAKDVYCFLFTDMLLVTKPTKRGNKVKVTKPPMRLDKIVIHTGLKDPASFLLLWLNEYHVASAVYTFHGEAKAWTEHIRKAQKDYRQMRQNALDRAEQRPYLYDVYEDVEDDYAVVNYRQAFHEMDHSVASRMDSINSVDLYLPNHSEGPHREGEETRSRLSSSASFPDDFRDLETSQRPRSITMSSLDIKRARSPQLQHARAENGDLSIQDSPGQSPPSSPSQNRIALQRARLRSDSQRSDQTTFALPNRPDLIFINDESTRSKLKRSRNERRYHTADHIQEMNRDSKMKESAIQKRSSWNLGTAVDINIGERDSVLRNKTISSDSLRSMPSSSGVSSTGSLHYSPEGDMCEELEAELDLIQIRHSQSDSQVSEGIETDTDSTVVSDLEKLSLSAIEVPPPGENEVGGGVEDGLSSQRSVSKSMPDISLLNLVARGELEEGIASVELIKSPGVGGKPKMSHAQLLRMRKQLLLNCTLEASDEEAEESSEDSII